MTKFGWMMGGLELFQTASLSSFPQSASIHDNCLFVYVRKSVEQNTGYQKAVQCGSLDNSLERTSCACSSTLLLVQSVNLSEQNQDQDFSLKDEGTFCQ